MLNASFCRCTSVSKVRHLSVAIGMRLFEMKKAKTLSIREKSNNGRIERHMEMPEAFMATNS